MATKSEHEKIFLHCLPLIYVINWPVLESLYKFSQLKLLSIPMLYLYFPHSVNSIIEKYIFYSLCFKVSD